jgi:hypothetical protein
MWLIKFRQLVRIGEISVIRGKKIFLERAAALFFMPQHLTVIKLILY